ncbi:MAG: hypothetical protein M3277_08725 [Actinomycetota bacterium]|nr:hypothetical protein [Actinomycetota bacterium]
MFAARSFKVTVAGLFFAGSLLSPVASASDSACQKPHDSQATRTFGVQVRVIEDVYRLGEKAEFPVKVTRVLHGEVVGPVEGAEVAVDVDLGDVNLVGGAVTNADGKAVVNVLLRRDAPTGFADVTAYAHKHTADLPCHSELEQEYGDVEKGDLFRVTR